MATFQLLSCNVMLGGDMLNVVARHAHNPVTYPEMLTLKYLHGENSVNDVYDIGAVDRDPDQEKARLISIYGGAVILEKMFPGHGNRIPEGDNAIKRDPAAKRKEMTKLAPDLPSPLNADFKRAPEGPGTALTTPVNYGGTAEQTGGGYMPNASPGNIPHSAPRFDTEGKVDATLDDGGGIVVTDDVPAITIDPMVEFAVPSSPPVNVNPATLRGVSRKMKPVPGEIVTVGDDIPADSDTKGADTPEPQVTVGSPWGDKIGT